MGTGVVANDCAGDSTENRAVDRLGTQNLRTRRSQRQQGPV
jgi:hypothetical protein